MKKSLCLILSLLLMISLVLPAFAAELPSEQSELPASDSTKPPPPQETSGQTQPPACTHSWNGGLVDIQATCKDPGTMRYTCTLCGASRTETIPATGVHTYGHWANVDGSTHKHACTGCGVEETASHVWDEGSVQPLPTCSTEGVRTFHCSCGATRTESVPVNASAHTYGEWGGDENSHTRTCTGCGKTESGSHSWDGGTVQVPATCLEEGIEALICSVCNGILYEIIPIGPHTYDSVCDPDCNVCGEKRDAGHKWSEAWSKNASGHWHACTACGEKKDMADHYPGPAATEEEAQICLTCGYTLTAKLNHTHKYSKTWSHDETGHWYACDGCEEQKEFAWHEYDDLCDPDCNICGYESPTAHSYNEDWKTSETGHWRVCVICGEEGSEEAHVPGPEATEEEAQLCSVCGFELAPAIKHIHETTDVWVTDETGHWKDCPCGEKVDEGLHLWDAGVENEDSTVTYTCEECQAQRTEGEPKESGGIFWWIVLLVLVVVCAGAVVVLIFVLRGAKTPGKFAKK